ncbi:MAG: glutathione S-transferase family protein [Rhizobiales bacterium]|nr:glutathione S-transferase family protein [Hyphomicrobiales bacterium]
MIELMIFPPAFNCRSPSPFSMKAELLMKMAKVKYKAVYLETPSKAPNSKLPYIIDDGVIIADSHFIYQHICKKYNVNLDCYLTDAEKAVSKAFSRLIEDHLYWVCSYARWLDDDFGQQVSVFFGKLPPIIRNIVPYIVRKEVFKASYSHGIGRHSKEKIYQLGSDDVAAIVTQLAGSKFFMGDKPSSIDAIVYGILSEIIYPNASTPLQKYASNFDCLRTYLKTIETEYDFAPINLKEVK